MIDESKLLNFVSQMNAAYEEDTILNSFRHVSQYDEKRHGDMSFIQIGRRHNLPKRFFYEDDNYHNIQLAESFANSIVSGEQVFIANSCIESPSIDSLQIDGIPDLDDLLQAYKKLPNPDHLFVPIYKEYHRQIDDMINNYGSYKGDFETIDLGNAKVNVHWLSTDSEIRNLVFVDSGYFPIVQKYGGQAEQPGGVNIIEEYSDFSKDNKLICDFGEREDSEENEDEFDFVYRTVLSEPSLTEYSGFVLEVPDTIELTS